MPFFKPKPNIGDHEKARIEFHLQEIAESIGFERFQLPVLRSDQLRDLALKSSEQIVVFAGEHLSHGTAGLQVQVGDDVKQKENCGGGG